MKTTYIYGIRCLEIDKYIYVGKSNGPKTCYGRIGNSHNEYVQKFVEEWGEDNFQVERLEEVKFKESKRWVEQEEFWIEKLGREGHPLCNKNNGGSGCTEHTEQTIAKMCGENNSRGMLGKHHTKEARAKMRRSRLGKKHTEKTKEKIRKASLNPSEEIRKKMSVALSGKNNPMYGVSRTGKNNPFYGKTHTKEAKATVGKKNAKVYPAFYNVKTGQLISIGKNLKKICRGRCLTYQNMLGLKNRNTQQSQDGWKLATEEEIARFDSHDELKGDNNQCP